MVTKSIKLLISKYVSELKKNGIEISKVILFGSYADGNPTKNSDIDLAIISPQFDDGNKEKYSSILWLCTEVVDYIIEPIGIGEKFFHGEEFSPLLDLLKAKGLEVPA